MRTVFIVPLLMALLVLAGCTGPAYPTGNQAVPVINTTPNSTPAVQAAKVFDRPIYGKILANSQGLTLYVFTKDSMGVSSCNDAACLSKWAPVLADAIPDVPEAPGIFTIFTRSDEGRQLAYNGMPLYTFLQDVAPGDAGGQAYGGLWFVAQINMTSFPAPMAQNNTNATQNVTQNATQNATQNVTQNPTPAPAVKAVRSAAYGPVMTDSQGFTLYVYTGDSSYTSNCDAGCASTWPPLISSTVPQVSGAKGIFGLITRSDGTQQVVYSGMPLYRYSGDASPGTFNGAGMLGQWYVATTNMTSFPQPPAPPGYGGY